MAERRRRWTRQHVDFDGETDWALSIAEEIAREREGTSSLPASDHELTWREETQQ